MGYISCGNGFLDAFQRMNGKPKRCIGLSSIMCRLGSSAVHVFSGNDCGRVVCGGRKGFLQRVDLTSSRFGCLLRVRNSACFFHNDFDGNGSRVVIASAALQIGFPVLPFSSGTSCVAQKTVVLGAAKRRYTPSVYLFGRVCDSDIFLLAPSKLGLSFVLHGNGCTPSLRSMGRFVG